ncbi:peroxisomal leader peptide-processing protease [Lingula anatina]|uniref:Peroxisomal leader peptide-processing protease n=1 Tax=Lingula anatina TaxID=7574 RepID=A0A1S3J3A2_LINAN|nr:peroxisomal leader peptide-processing protease [Lingula anatina]|eukprot:XP_013404339.1 peroxisomal leader peptide-processing protease [Lingula anatina]
MYEETCVVIARKTGKREKLEEASCSGVVLDQKKGIVLTHASILTSFMSRGTSVKLHRSGCLYQKDVPGVCNISILLKSKTKVRKSDIQHRRHGAHPNFYTSVVNCSQQDNYETNINSYPADIISIFKCKCFANTVLALLPESDGWKLSEETSDKAVELISKILLSCFVVLKLRHDLSKLGDLEVDMFPDQPQITIGETSYICGTPFGSLSPEVFMNSLSKGIVSNVSRDGSLVLTDARCIPGSEGGAFYVETCNDLQRRLCGIVVSPLCWKNNEWIGMAIICSLSAVFHSLQEFVLGNPQEVYLSLTASNKDKMENIKAMSRRVVLVTCGSSWGSGIIVDATNGIVLTCSHVLKGNHARKVMVRQDLDHSQLWHNAEVLYKNVLGAVYDVAVLKLIPNRKVNNNERTQRLNLDFGMENHAETGAEVFVIGHGLIAVDKELTPSLSKGMVSKVIFSPSNDQQCVMIQTTCAVHGGASGGAVVSSSGRLLGMVTCNAKDVESGASYPHVNMSVPFTELWPVISEYSSSKDPSCFEKLHVKDKLVENLWLLRKTDEDSDEVKSKL